MNYVRMPIEIESPEQMGYENVKYNLTESSFADAQLGNLDLDLRNLILCYGDHQGNRRLRELIAADSGVTPDEVLITAGAASALFVIATSLLRAGDRLLVERPNYATNIETPRAIGAAIDFLALRFEEGFRPNLDRLAHQIHPQTKLVSLTVPHNPTGSMLSEAELRQIIDLCARKGVTLLVDETYREMAFSGPLPVAASLVKPTQQDSPVLSVSSLSKTWGLPGIRIGWLICRDRRLMETLLAAKEQIFICNSVVDEEIALRFLERKAQFSPAIFAAMKRNFEVVDTWMSEQSALEWVRPEGGVVCFPRFRDSYPIDIERFYRVLNTQHKTFVGPGHWFEMDRKYMRIGYGWPKYEELVAGLAAITQAAQEARI